MSSWGPLVAAVAVLSTSVGIGASTPIQARVADPVGPTEAEWSAVVDRAVIYLKTAQAEDGSFSKDKSLGVTGVVVAGILQTGRVPPGDPFLAKSLAFLESLIDQKQGHIAGRNPRDQLKNYVTAVNVMAFAAANQDGKYQQVLAMASHYLKELQWDEGEGKPPQDSYYGGAGYDSKSRPDLSNTQFFLDALKAAGVPPSDPAYQKALRFISRCQNLRGEYNDQPWAGKINDGSFIYTAAGGGETKADETPDGGKTGYGSMTYAGIKSMIYAGVDKNDPRVKAAWDWIQRNYTLEENPGMPKSRSKQGMFYYYHTMAKCLDALGVDYVVDPKGVKHDWRKELTAELAKRQQPDGSWLNEHDRWMEGDANLVTGYALLALSYCKPKK